MSTWSLTGVAKAPQPSGWGVTINDSFLSNCHLCVCMLACVQEREHTFMYNIKHTLTVWLSCQLK